MDLSSDRSKERHLIKEAAATVLRLLLPAVGGAVVALVVLSLIEQSVWGNQSWLLYAASRVLDGAQIGTDIVETNPPTIIWLSEVPVALSRLIGVLPQTAMKICIGLLLCFSASWCASMVRRFPHAASDSMAIWFAIAISYATTVYCWAYVGEREHIMMLLLVPYLTIAALRLDGVSLSPVHGFLAGALGATALSMKPHHLLIVAGVELLLAYRTGFLRSVVRPEAIGAIAAVLTLCAAIAIFAPDYITKVVPLDYGAYVAFHHVPLVALLAPSRIAKIVALLALYAVTRRRLQYRALGDVFAIAAIGAAIAYLIQQKGWEYQFAPADAFFLLLLAIIAAGAFLRWTAPLRKAPLRAGIASVTALASCLLVGAFYYPIQAAKAAANIDQNRVPVQQEILGALPAGTSVVVLGPNYATVLDYVLTYHLTWGSRTLGYWTLEALFDAEAGADEKVRKQESAQLEGVEHWTRAAADGDLRLFKPSVVLVELCADPTITCGTSDALRKIDVLQWFERDPTFTADWEAYQRCRRLGYYDIWYLKEDGSLCEALASIPPPDRALTFSRAVDGLSQKTPR